MTPESFQALTATRREPMLLLARDGRVLAANRAARAFLGGEGVNGSGLVGRNLAELVTDAPGRVERALGSWASSGFIAGHELSVRDPDGRARMYRGEGMRIEQPDPLGSPLVLLRCVPTDAAGDTLASLSREVDALHAEVQERAVAEERLRRAEERVRELLAAPTQQLAPAQAEEAPPGSAPAPTPAIAVPPQMQALGNLAGGIAHDFNNLLTVIGAEVALALEQPDLNGEVRESLDAVQIAADRAATLVASLLAFARRQVVQPSRFDLRDLIRDTLPDVDRAVGDAVAVVVTQAPEPLPVSADRAQLRQAFMNLVANARDASRVDAHVWVRTRRAHLTRDFVATHPGSSEGAHAALVVADDGRGIPKSVLPHIFEPFFSTKEAGHAKGLGLSQAYGVVKTAGGYLQVESTEDQGTTATIYLPLSET